MKKLILVLAIMASLVSFAQERGGRGQFKSEQDVEAHLKRMSADLNLTDKQQSEVKLILMEQFNKRKQIREEMKKEKEAGTQISDEKKAEMKKHMIDEQLEMKTKLKKVLSEEQMKKLSELRKQKGNEMRKQGNEKREKAPGEKKPVEKEVK